MTAALALPAEPATAVRTLVILGDSAAVGLGDPVPGGWRGFGALLGAALGASVVNPARTGARMACVRRDQLPVALRAVADGSPAVAVLLAGMNDTLRSDFDPAAIRDDCAAAVDALLRAGAYVVVARHHDHTRVFRLPGPLGRALRRRIGALNATVDDVAAAYPVGVLDLHALPGGYAGAAWAVDRLHPSELGHRLLAAQLGELVAGAGFAVPEPVSLRCAGGRRVTSAHRLAWLVVKGVPWLVRRGRDLGPVVVHGLVDGMRSSAGAGGRRREGQGVTAGT